MSKLCTLQNYPLFFEKSFSLWKSYNTKHATLESNEAIVYSSYEITFRGLQDRRTQASEDAVELLKLFSFFHRQNIRVDVLIQAATNPRIETREQKKQQQIQSISNPTPKAWTQTAKDLARSLYMLMMRIGETPVLPKVLRDSEKSGRFDEFRLRAALKELHQMSFIDHNPRMTVTRCTP